jgi:SAM-dependent methyltransferase
MSYLTDIRGALMSRLPEPFVTAARRRMTVYRGRRARALLAKPSEGPSFLPIDELRALQGAYPSPPSYGYSLEKRKRRGEMRAAALDDLSPGPRGRRSLEVGCMDGMASAALRDRGWQATALDLSSKDFDPRARTSGVQLLEMDAARLQFPGDSFDLSFSYNAFEHIEEVEAAFAGAAAVVLEGDRLLLQELSR